MSDNLIIREDGIGRLIRGVDALEIKLQGGGTSRWVRFNPRDQKSVSANGEYHAKDDGVDGYRTITVNVPTRTKSQEPGRDQEIFNPDTGTGYYTDDNGYLHEEVVPDEIRIMHVPDKTTYQDGEPIDLEGIMVQAYRDGEVWTSAKYPDGYIPVHELTYSPHEAAQEGKYYYDPRTGRTYTVYTQLSHDYFLKYDYIYHYTSHSKRYRLDFNSQAMYAAQNGIFIITSRSGLGYLIGKTPDAVCNVFCKKWGTNYCYSPERSEDKNENYTFNVGSVKYLDHDTEKPYYYKLIYSNSLGGKYGTSDYYFPEASTVREVNYAIRGDYYDYDVLPPDFYDHADDRYNTSFLGRLLYGATDGDMVRVSWERPKDKKILTAKFSITVEAAP